MRNRPPLQLHPNVDTFFQNLIGALWQVTLHDNENLSAYYWTDRSKA
jgi:hypothetical protein